jgi:RNA polymerase sigma factor (sigma-70 family)
MSDYRIDIKVKNNNILSKIEEAGYKTLAEFCIKNGKKNWQGAIGEFINLKKSPINSRGEYHPSINWLCDILYCMPEDFFTGVQMNTELETNKRSVVVNEAELQFTLGCQKEAIALDDHVARLRLPQKVNEVLETLTQREEKIINLRFGLKGNYTHTLEQIASVFNINRERVRQIEAKALRKLRHPSRSEELKDFL